MGKLTDFQLRLVAKERHERGGPAYGGLSAREVETGVLDPYHEFPKETAAIASARAEMENRDAGRFTGTFPKGGAA